MYRIALAISVFNVSSVISIDSYIFVVFSCILVSFLFFLFFLLLRVGSAGRVILTVSVSYLLYLKLSSFVCFVFVPPFSLIIYCVTLFSFAFVCVCVCVCVCTCLSYCYTLHNWTFTRCRHNRQACISLLPVILLSWS
jgi:hypothetical protein